jgi:hypothetical protein
MEDELHILQHSLGLNGKGQGVQYRNHFVTGPGSADHAICMALVERGFMTRRQGSALSGWDDVFHVTDAGIAHARTASRESAQQ